MDTNTATVQNTEIDPVDPITESTLEDSIESLPYSNVRERKVVIQPYDWPVRTLMDMVVDGDLVLDPDYQRNYRWSDDKASRFIESILLNIPVPVIYLAEEQDSSYTIIDGQQRITSLFRYMRSSELTNIFPSEELTELTIQNLIVRSDLNDKKFTALENIDRSILSKRPIRCIVVLNESDATLKYEVFERLNTGSSELTHQEVRNCIYRGSFNKLLKELSKNETFVRLLNLPKADQDSMKTVELALRFFAYRDLEESVNYSDNYNEYLNNYMDINKEISNQREEQLRALFNQTVELIDSVLGSGVAFRKAIIDEDSAPKFNKRLINGAIFESQMVAFSRLVENENNKSIDELRKLCLESFLDENYTNNLYQGTARKARAIARSRYLTNKLLSIE